MCIWVLAKIGTKEESNTEEESGQEAGREDVETSKVERNGVDIEGRSVQEKETTEIQIPEHKETKATVGQRQHKKIIESGSMQMSSQQVSTKLKGGSTDKHLKDLSKICPTWSAFNSLIGKKPEVWNVGIAAPLYRRSPTEWSVLLTILMQAQKINCVTAGEGCRPIITLDGDLYDRAVKLKDYKRHWCIRLGALRVIMAALKCLGRYVEGSGLDLAWEESGLYGSATVRQILEGRRVYRSIEAHTVTLIALHYLLLQLVFQDDKREELGECIEQLHDLFTDKKVMNISEEVIRQLHMKLSSNNFFSCIAEWKGDAKGVQEFLLNYMNQVEVLLMFIVGTQGAGWKLHLAKMEELLPYFHAHDLYNYGRWGPLYVADMIEMQQTDRETWRFLNEGNFVITKHPIPFTGIDPDHAIEQEHKKKMKGKFGFVGITGNEHALEKFFIIAPSLSRIVEEFKDYSGIESRQASSLHHERVGGKSSKMIMNASRLVDAVTKQGNPLKQRDMFNLVTFAVTPAEVSQNIESRDHLGNEALEKFVSTRMVDKTVHFWDPQKKNNFTYYKDVGAVSKSTINGQLVTIKQESNLLSRLLVVAKSRPEYSVKDAIGEYEFNTTIRANFHPDGLMIMLSGKSSAAQLIMDLPSTTTISESTPEGSSTAPKVLIIDAMCVVNMVKKTSTEKFTAALFASELLIKITKLSRP